MAKKKTTKKKPVVKKILNDKEKLSKIQQASGKSNKIKYPSETNSEDIESEETQAISEVELAPKVNNKELSKSKKIKIKTLFSKERIVTENSNEARELYNQSRYGTILENGQVQLSLHEALYLLEKNKIELMDGRKKNISSEEYLKKANKIEPNFWIRYSVFKDMRNRGYIIKTALKFGADFRVYDRGIKPGEDHARWVVYPVHEGSTLTWYEFAAKNRVAHSTKKRLMIAVVDDEADVTYWEIKWVRP